MESEPRVRERMLEFVRAVPRGKVVSYGQVAAAAGVADVRLVAWALHSANAADVPWWRVVSNEGRISIKDPTLKDEQRRLLRSEDIAVTEDYRLDIAAFRYGHASAHRQRRLW